MPAYRQFVFAGVLILALTALVVPRGTAAVPASSPEFRAYWYDQGAEISRYRLDQSRYGEIHSGHAVLIFVTESFNPIRQVKADDPGAPDAVPALKLNMTRKFLTGVYPYSIMTSVFTPLAGSRLPPKISFSIQEWCGHVFMQLNLDAERYRVQQRSYFESESDRDFTLPAVISEDGLWTQIRLRPEQLPTGAFSLIPAPLYARLTHTPLTQQAVTAQRSRSTDRGLEGQSLMLYTLRFTKSGRVLKIRYGADFPHRIEGWEDTYRVAAYFGGQELTTTARRTHTLMIDYWNRHQPEDRHWRTRLGLTSP
ncbi:MAG: hypothetical protein QNJ22_21400 [Desulfosarcinaceae bacterium]|nr:hypothetical protein [Desulfosarcinaceae bacterium]